MRLILLIIGLCLLVTCAYASTVNVSAIVPYSAGDYIYCNISANSTLFSTPIVAAHYVHIDDSQWHPNPLEAENGDPFATFVYNGFAVVMINIFAYVSGRLRIRFNMIFVAIWGGIFFLWGWLATSSLLVGVGVAFAIITYFRYAEEESTS